jgi:hypothetical protein
VGDVRSLGSARHNELTAMGRELSMNSNPSVSRRSILALLASCRPAAASALSAEASSADAELIALGCRFDLLTSQIDRAIECGSDIGWEVLHRFDGIESEIVATQARTIDGLRVKARAACWALLGDFDSADQSTTDKRMMASIARDLMRLSQWT